MGVLDQSMGKECIRLGPRLQLAGGWKDYGSILHLDSGAWSADLSTLEDAQRILGHRSACFANCFLTRTARRSGIWSMR